MGKNTLDPKPLGFFCFIPSRWLPSEKPIPFFGWSLLQCGFEGSDPASI